jgi:hypothetical protein
MNPNEVVGMAKEAAIEKINAAGMRARIRSEDGKAFMGTCDVQIDRINLHIEGGIVVRASAG